MIEKTAKKIIELTCSKTLQDAIVKTQFEISDWDLLYLVYNNAPDYKTKLELLQLIEVDTKNIKTKKQARKCLDYEQANYERFVSQEDDCIFEVKIKSEPSAYEEHYIAKTFENINITIQNFCAHYEVKFTEQTRFVIIKRKFTDGMTVENFDEDWRGEARYKGEFILTEVSHEDLRDKTVLASNRDCGDKDCDECEQKPCMLNYAPKLPPFLNNLDLVCYTDSEGMQQYSVFFGDMRTGEADDCAYLIQLNNNALCKKTINTKEQFFERIFNLHEHIEFPRLDVAKISEVPADIKKVYKTYLQLYNRFNEAKLSK